MSEIEGFACSVRDPQVETGFCPPLVILLHDDGGNEDEILARWTPFLVPTARIVSVRGPMAVVGGYGWFDRKGKDFAETLDRVSDVVDAICNRFAPKFAQRVVCGEGQGGSLALALFLRGHVVTQHVAVGAELPFEFRPDYDAEKRGWVECFLGQGTSDPSASVEAGRELHEWVIGRNRPVYYREFEMGRTPSEECLADIARWIGPMHPSLVEFPIGGDGNVPVWDVKPFLEQCVERYAHALRIHYQPLYSNRSRVLIELACSGFLSVADLPRLSLDIAAQIAGYIAAEFPAESLDQDMMGKACFCAYALGVLAGKRATGDISPMHFFAARLMLVSVDVLVSADLDSILDTVEPARRNAPSITTSTWDRMEFFDRCVQDFAVHLALAGTVLDSDFEVALLTAARAGFLSYADPADWSDEAEAYLRDILAEECAAPERIEPVIRTLGSRHRDQPGAAEAALLLYTAYAYGALSGLYCQGNIDDDVVEDGERWHVPFYRIVYASQILRNMRRALQAAIAEENEADTDVFVECVEILAVNVGEHGAYGQLGVPTRWWAFAWDAFGNFADRDAWPGDIERDVMSRLRTAVALPLASFDNAYSVAVFIATVYGVLAAKRHSGEIDRSEQLRLERCAIDIASKRQGEIGHIFVEAGDYYDDPSPTPADSIFAAVGGGPYFDGAAVLGIAIPTVQSRGVLTPISDSVRSYSDASLARFLEEVRRDRSLVDRFSDAVADGRRACFDRGYLDRAGGQAVPQRLTWSIEDMMDMFFGEDPIGAGLRPSAQLFGGYLLGSIKGDVDSKAIDLNRQSELMSALTRYCAERSDDIAAGLGDE